MYYILNLLIWVAALDSHGSNIKNLKVWVPVFDFRLGEIFAWLGWFNIFFVI